MTHGGPGRSLYDVLGVPSDADQDMIKRAYRRKALLVHPDRPTSSSNTAFQETVHAYDVLCNPERRSQYDLHHGFRSELMHPLYDGGDGTVEFTEYYAPPFVAEEMLQMGEERRTTDLMWNSLFDVKKNGRIERRTQSRERRRSPQRRCFTEESSDPFGFGDQHRWGHSTNATTSASRPTSKATTRPVTREQKVNMTRTESAYYRAMAQPRGSLHPHLGQLRPTTTSGRNAAPKTGTSILPLRSATPSGVWVTHDGQQDEPVESPPKRKTPFNPHEFLVERKAERCRTAKVDMKRKAVQNKTMSLFFGSGNGPGTGASPAIANSQETPPINSLAPVKSKSGKAKQLNLLQGLSITSTTPVSNQLGGFQNVVLDSQVLLPSKAPGRGSSTRKM